MYNATERNTLDKTRQGGGRAKFKKKQETCGPAEIISEKKIRNVTGCMLKHPVFLFRSCAGVFF